MEIRRITEDEVESFNEYKKLLLDMNDTLSNLTEIIFDGNQYILSYEGDCVAAVLNDGSGLKPFVINEDDPIFKIFGNADYVYNIVDSELKEVIRSTMDEREEVRVTYLPKIDNYPRDLIEFLQHKRDIRQLVEFTYDVTNRSSLASALEYTKYHKPDKIRLQHTRLFLNRLIRKTYYYNLGLYDESSYFMPRFVIKEHEFGTRRTIIDSNGMMKEMEDEGYSLVIPEDLQTLITNTNQDYKTLKLIDKEYKNFIKGQ